MAQADLNIANQSGSAFRADLNNQLLALGTLMSGASEPSTTYAYMLWADTTASVLKMRNAANNGWVILRGLEGKLSVGSSAPGANVNLRLNRDIAGATTSFGQYVDAEVAATVTTSAIGIGTSLSTAASTSLGSLIHYQAGTGTLGAGTSITNQIGFSASSSIDGATNDFGFYGNIAAGSGNWNCYMVGAAPSFFNHQVQINAGSVSAPSVSTNGDTNTGIYFPAADTIGFVEGGVEAARIDSSGRLLVNTSASLGNGIAQFRANADSSTGEGVILLAKGDAATAGQSLGQIRFINSSGNQAAWITGEADTGWGGSGSADYPGRLVFSTTADGASSPTERMRLDNKGSLSLWNPGNTTAGPQDVDGRIFAYSDGSNSNLYVDSRRSDAFVHINQSFGDTANRGAVAFYRNESQIGSISISSAQVFYNTTSDHRLKENVVDLEGATELVKQLQPRQFNFISEPDKVVRGFIAHEVQAIAPEAVTGEKDAEDENGNPKYQGIDQSKLVPLLTAALQEAVAKIESLEARLTAAGI